MREIYAWVAEDIIGDEGIVMIPVGGLAFPLVAIDPIIAAYGETDAIREAAKRRGKKVRLVKYREVEVMEEIEP